MNDAVKEYIEKEERLLNEEWVLGYMDRGHGHGSYGVVTVSHDEVLCPCSQELAAHLVKIHNNYIEK